MKIITHPLAQKEFERQIQWLKKYGYLVNSADVFYNEIQRDWTISASEPTTGKSSMHPDITALDLLRPIPIS